MPLRSGARPGTRRSRHTPRRQSHEERGSSNRPPSACRDRRLWLSPGSRFPRDARRLKLGRSACWRYRQLFRHAAASSATTVPQLESGGHVDGAGGDTANLYTPLSSNTADVNAKTSGGHTQPPIAPATPRASQADCSVRLFGARSISLPYHGRPTRTWCTSCRFALSAGSPDAVPDSRTLAPAPRYARLRAIALAFMCTCAKTT